MAAQPGVVPRQAVALAVAVDQPVLGHPVELVGERHRIGLERRRAPPPSGAAPPRRPRRRRRRSRARSAYLRGPVEQLPLHLERGDRRPVGQLERPPQREVVGHLAHAPAPGVASAEVARAARRPRSSHSTIAVVPTLRNVATSDRLASPTITWRRRYFWASACGSSRVLTIGRFSVVSRPTSSSKKSARWVSWNGTSCGRQPGRLDADLAGAGEDLAGDEVRHDVGDDPRRTAPRGPSGSSRGSRSCCPCRRSCSCRRRSPGPAGSVRPAASIDRCRISSAARSYTHDLAGVGALGRGELGVGVVDVVAGAVGEHGVDEVRLDLGRACAPSGVNAPGVVARRLVLEVPADLARLDCRLRGVT